MDGYNPDVDPIKTPFTRRWITLAQIVGRDRVLQLLEGIGEFRMVGKRSKRGSLLPVILARSS